MTSLISAVAHYWLKPNSPGRREVMTHIGYRLRDSGPVEHQGHLYRWSVAQGGVVRTAIARKPRKPTPSVEAQGNIRFVRDPRWAWGGVREGNEIGVMF